MEHPPPPSVSALHPELSSSPSDPAELSAAKSSHSAEDADKKQLTEQRSHINVDEKQPLLLNQSPKEPKSDTKQVSPEGSSNPTPDVRYVLSGQPTGWAAMAETVRAYDEEKVKDTKEDVDTLLVFAGLFSAVLTAFIVESYQNLSPNTSSQMLAVMQQIALQTASYNTVNGMINATSQPPVEITNIASQPFQPSSSDICVNVLWFASLIFSLITASFGMLVKQWLREYLAVENPSPQARLRIRRFRYPELMQWNVFEIAAILPLLQQMALALFFIGLCYFTQSVHESVGHTSLPLVAGWAFCFSTVTILPMFFPRCPYKTTLLKHFLQSIHMRSIQAMRNITQRLSTWQQSADYESWRDLALRWTLNFIMKIDNHASKSDEERAIVAERADLDILVDVDALQSNDELLGSTILESLHQIQPDWDNVVDFVLRVLEHRLQRGDLATGSPMPLDLRTLSRPGRTAIIDILSYYSRSAISQYVQSDQAIVRWQKSKQTMFAFFIFFSPARYALPKTAITVLNEVLQHKGTPLIELLARSYPRPVDLSEDKFSLLVSGLMSVLEDLDVNLTLSLHYFETLMNVRFREANAAQVDAVFPDGNFVVQEDLEAWPWRQVMSPDARTDGARLMISTIHRALKHMKQSANASASHFQSQPRAPAATALRPPPSRLFDGIVGMWNMAFVGKIDGYSHTQELRFRAAIEEFLTMKETTLALLRALGQIKSSIIVECQTKWPAPPCGPWLLIEDGQHKLNNLIDAVNGLSTRSGAAINTESHDKTSPISTAHLLVIYYVVLHMIELPDATMYNDQWASLCTGLTYLRNEQLQPPQMPRSPIDDTDEATPTAHQFNVPAKPPTYDNPSSPSNPRPPHQDILPRPGQSPDDALSECQMLAERCLELVQRHDIQALDRTQDDSLSEDPDIEAEEAAYEDWLSRFTKEDSVIDDSFVKMLGTIYDTGFYHNGDTPFFRLRKMGMWDAFGGRLAHTVLDPGSGDDLASVSEPMADDTADPWHGDDDACEVLSVDDLKFDDDDNEKSTSAR